MTSSRGEPVVSLPKGSSASETMSSRYISRQGYIVSKSELTKEQDSKIRSELHVRADWDPRTSYGPPPPRFKVYIEDAASYCLPVQWGQNVFGSAENRFKVGKCPNMHFNGSLNEKLRQPFVVKSTMDALHTQGGGILSSHVGSGKTVVALHVACALKVKTLVVVNKSVLLEQWQERITSFMPGCRIGRIQGPICDVEGKEIVVAMLQSLSQKEYDVRGFGFSIIDECNHVAAPTFSQAMLRINCPYRLGLSATPERKDGLTKVLLWFLGPIFLTLQRENQHCVKVDTIHFDCLDFRSAPPSRFGKLNFEGVVETLCEHPQRNACIIDKVLQLYMGRRILILSARRPHCQKLCNLLQSHGVDAAIYLGGMRKEQLEDASRANVIVATYSIAAEGLDIPALNTLVLATPKKDVVQACGRILRGVGGPVAPVVVDVRDAWPCLLGQYYARRRYYKQTKFNTGESEATAETSDQACSFSASLND